MHIGAKSNLTIINMSKKAIIFILVLVLAAVAIFLIDIEYISKNGAPETATKDIIQPVPENPASSNPTLSTDMPNIPLEQAGKRVTKKPFGIFITPQDSPVQPEKFRGYHTGADYEIFPEEENIEVPVRAICDGELRIKQFISGYGGVVIEDCQIEGEDVTVLYGHLTLTSIGRKVGEAMLKDEVIGNLGDPSKGETDGERKHLHLAIHKGAAVDYRGYVGSQNELSDWIDPCLYFCK